jgi:AcrR family transcriptional regulator
MSDTALHIRRQPSQDRSTQRFELILNTMAELIDEVGYSSITISLIAKRGEMSGPAVYRYFDDVQSISRALATRNLNRFVEKASAVIADGNLEWPDTMLSALDSLCEMHRTEPGFRWLRLGDGIDRNLIDSTETNRKIVSKLLADLFIQRYGDWNRPNLLKHIETVVEIAETLVAKAFETDPDGDTFFIDEARRVVVVYLDEYVARPYDKA